MAVTSRTGGFLPRLSDEAYQGQAVVFWTHTVHQRSIGWLDARFHATFRELMLHTAIRENLYCPIYTLMPDHFHLIWMGVSKDSDQRVATRFLRSRLGKTIKPHKWQHQPHDRVLREEERKQKTFMAMAHYIAENPVRAGLVDAAGRWDFTGCLVPGYPNLHPLENDYWGKFWRMYAAATLRGSIGKLGDDSATAV